MLNAVYTMCYKDVLELSPHLLDGIVWDTEEHTAKLLDMIYSKYFNYEISGETIDEQRLFMLAKFNEYKDYYAEMLTVYEEQIAWLDGEIVTEEETVEEDKEKILTPRAEYVNTETPGVINTTKTYDLPRSSASENRPSSVSETTPTGSTVTSTKGYTGDDTTTEDNSSTRNVTRSAGNQVMQKEKMLKLIRSVYSEFADKFKPCFLTLFS